MKNSYTHFFELISKKIKKGDFIILTLKNATTPIEGNFLEETDDYVAIEAAYINNSEDELNQFSSLWSGYIPEVSIYKKSQVVSLTKMKKHAKKEES